MGVISVITDGDEHIGLGHITRMMSLLKPIKSNHHITFIVPPKSVLIELLERAEFSYHSYQSNEEISEFISQSDVLLIDLPAADHSLHHQIQGIFSGFSIGFGVEHEYANYIDVLVNSTGHSDALQDLPDILYGPEYALLGDEFLDNQNPYVYQHNLKNFLVSFGGADPGSLSIEFLHTIADHYLQYNFNLVIGKANAKRVEIEALVKNLPNINTHFDVSDMKSLMSEHDFYICSPGVSLFEAYCLGMPTIGIFQNDWQRSDFGSYPNMIEKEQMVHVISLAESIYSGYSDYKNQIDAMNVGKGKQVITQLIEEHAK